LAQSQADYTRLSWELTQARAAKAVADKSVAAAIIAAGKKARAPIDPLEPTDPTARRIVEISRRIRGENK
jgi:hypothetical protein